MKPHPTSLRVIFADSASNQERSPYPPPSRPSPPASATADDRSAPAAGVIGARMIGCSMLKNLVNRVLIITFPLYFAANSAPVFAARRPTLPHRCPATPQQRLWPFGHWIPLSLAIRHPACAASSPVMPT